MIKIYEEKAPKYYLLKKKLIERIKSDEFKSDVPILSERELVETYRVSRITVRKAIEELIKEGYIYTIQGKGTYLKNNKFTHDLFEINSCTEDVIRLGKNPSKLVIKSEIIKAGNELAKELNLSTDENVFSLGRVTFADEEPLNYTITYLPEKKFDGIQMYDFEKESLYKIVQEKYKIKIIRARRTIEAVACEGEIADYLKIDKGMPIILFGCITYGIINGKEMPIETFKCYYRTDKYKFYIDQVK